MSVPSHLSRTLASAALAALAACQGSDPLTAPAPEAAPVIASRPLLVPSALLVALDDVDVRVMPALDASTRASMRVSLAALRAALDAGDSAAAERAIAAVRSLVAGHADQLDADRAVPAGDAADLDAVALLAEAAAQAIAAAPSTRRGS